MLCDDCNNKANFKKIGYGELGKCKSCGCDLKITQGKGTVHLILIIFLYVFVGSYIFSNMILFLLPIVIGVIYLKKNIFELKVLKASPVTNIHKTKKLAKIPLYASYIIFFFSIGLVYIGTKSRIDIEKKFDQVYIDFEKDTECVQRNIASENYALVKKCYKCNPGKVCKKRDIK